LGHVSPSSTAVYLTITTELLDCASERFAYFAANQMNLQLHHVISDITGLNSREFIK
jgi:hypothetical protein